jgi:hypothetical protein
MIESQKVTLIVKKELKNNNALSEFHWVGHLNFNNNDDELYINETMNWIGSSNVMKQVKLVFDNLADADLYAKKYDYKLYSIDREVISSELRKKSYLERFQV